jgi:amidase
VPNRDGLAFLPASEQAQLLLDREITSVELVDVYLERIERLDGPLNSYVTVLGERARSEAAEAHHRIAQGDDVGPLHGVPISIKDLHFLAGARITMGTASWEAMEAPMDEHGVSRLLGAGAVPLGKTNVPELGSIGHTATSLLGPCATPWDLDRNAGGSSGGAGAALAAGLCALAQGSDGGGSIRIPAAINGLVGLKPARDRVSNGPLLGELAFGLATSGALTRSVTDAALALDVMAGYEVGDPGMAPLPDRLFVEELRRPVGSCRVGISRQTPYTPEGLHPSVSDGLDLTVRVLEDLGHEVEEVDLRIGEEVAEQVRTIWAANVAAQPFDQDRYEPVNRYLVEVAREKTAADVAAAQFSLQLLARSIVQGTNHLDAVVAPVLTGPSRLNRQYDEWDGEAVFADQTSWVGITPVVNVTGQPAISLPIHHDEHHGPVGVQLIGRPWDEAGLLRLSAQLEEAVGWLDRPPPPYAA